jgi:hypothetical protein
MTHSEPVDYAQLARQFRPQTQASMEAAVRDLAARGYSDHTIAAVTELSTSIVRQIIGAPRT